MMENEIKKTAAELLNIWSQYHASLNAAAAGTRPIESFGVSHPYDYDEVVKQDAPDDGGAALAKVPSPAKHSTIVAEGDSWFDYPIKGDLLDALRKQHGYTIYELSKAGATLEDMVYGVDPRFWGKDVPQLFKTMQTVVERRPSIVLLSGGGNDIAGCELFTFLNRKAPHVPTMRPGVIDDIIDVVFYRSMRLFIESILAIGEKNDIDLKIVSHTYDFPWPDGRGYSITNWIPGFSYVGPWLKPWISKKGYSEAEGFDALKDFLQKFAQMHVRLTQQYPGKFITVNFHGTLEPENRDDWDNELHPTWSGFKRLAQKTHTAIQAN